MRPRVGANVVIASEEGFEACECASIEFYDGKRVLGNVCCCTCWIVGITGHTLSFGDERLGHVSGKGGVEGHVIVWRDWCVCWWVL